MQWNAIQGGPRLPHGFTLLELLTSIVILGIILGIGVPAVTQLNARSQQTTAINSFVRHLQLARSHAVKTARHHVLCPSADDAECLDTTHWEQGYILFEDSNRNGTRDREEPLLRTYHPTGGFSIGMQSSAGRRRIVYRADGCSAGSNLTLTFCDSEAVIPPKAVILSNTGRARLSTTHWDGSPLSCEH